jgi:hypothetical protein
MCVLIQSKQGFQIISALDYNFRIRVAIIMASKTKKIPKGKSKKTGAPAGLWIAPRYSLKGPQGERAWENRPGGAPSSSKYLELADVALGLKKPESTFKKRKGSNPHDTSKTEPYSS